MKRNQTLIEYLDRIPPFFCFALARDSRRHRPELVEMVKISGLNKRTFQRIARRISWAGVKVSQVDGFTKACGVNHSRLSEQKDFIAKTMKCNRPFRHLMARQLRDFQTQCARWKALRESTQDA